MRNQQIEVLMIEPPESRSCRRLQQDALIGQLHMYRKGMAIMDSGRLLVAEQIECARIALLPTLDGTGVLAN